MSRSGIVGAVLVTGNSNMKFLSSMLQSMLLVSGISGIRRTVGANTRRPLRASERKRIANSDIGGSAKRKSIRFDQVGLVEADVANACR
ncbi:hypothetical protein [Paraburkholderia strydomiana]